MAEYSTTFTLTTPGGVVTFNAGSGDEYLLDPAQCQGLDGATLRTPIDDKPQTDGGIVFPFYKTARHIILAGTLVNRTGTIAARNTMENTINTALNSILAADGTLGWTPSGGAAKTLTVRHEIPFTTQGYWLKTFVLGLVSANPVF